MSYGYETSMNVSWIVASAQRVLGEFNSENRVDAAWAAALESVVGDLVQVLAVYKRHGYFPAARRRNQTWGYIPARFSKAKPSHHSVTPRSPFASAGDPNAHSWSDYSPNFGLPSHRAAPPALAAAEQRASDLLPVRFRLGLSARGAAVTCAVRHASKVKLEPLSFVQYADLEVVVLAGRAAAHEVVDCTEREIENLFYGFHIDDRTHSELQIVLEALQTCGIEIANAGEARDRYKLRMFYKESLNLLYHWDELLTQIRGNASEALGKAVDDTMYEDPIRATALECKKLEVMLAEQNMLNHWELLIDGEYINEAETFIEEHSRKRARFMKAAEEWKDISEGGAEQDEDFTDEESVFSDNPVEG